MGQLPPPHPVHPHMAIAVKQRKEILLSSFIHPPYRLGHYALGPCSRPPIADQAKTECQSRPTGAFLARVLLMVGSYQIGKQEYGSKRRLCSRFLQRLRLFPAGAGRFLHHALVPAAGIKVQIQRIARQTDMHRVGSFDADRTAADHSAALNFDLLPGDRDIQFLRLLEDASRI